MKPAITINLPHWMQDEPCRKLFACIGGSPDDPDSLFVGGCVRNVYMGAPETDIDMATRLTPDEVMNKLGSAGIKVIPTGLQHGTVTAVIGEKSFEITTLRKDLETDGRHAQIAYTDDWVEDAKRRDFTINTLLADFKGNIYDPLGTGIKDIESRKVIFVGAAEQRIAEDYLRILRFFRFNAWYGNDTMDPVALVACRAAADKIDTLSRERITQEFLKIIAADRAAHVLKIMLDHDVLKNNLGQNFDERMLNKFIELQSKYEAKDILARLFVIAGFQARLFDNFFRLSHAQKKYLIKLDMVFKSFSLQSEREIKKAIYYHGNDVLVQGYLLKATQGIVIEDNTMFKVIAGWQAPHCPIDGEMLKAEGYKTGPELGQELERRREEWLEEII